MSCASRVAPGLRRVGLSCRRRWFRWRRPRGQPLVRRRRSSSSATGDESGRSSSPSSTGGRRSDDGRIDGSVGPGGQSRAPGDPTGLPAGLRGAAFDPTSRSLLVLTRDSDPDEVLFTRIGADDDTVATITLPANGDDWEAGAVAASDGEAWVSWGDRSVRRDDRNRGRPPGQRPVDPCGGCQQRALGGPDGRRRHGVARRDRETQLRGYDIAIRTWRTRMCRRPWAT